MFESLESRCLNRYLLWLEAECFAWIQLKSVGSSFLRNVVDRILPGLRRQLAGSMSGTPSTNIRSAMMKEILSGKFPTEKYRNVITQFPPGQDLNTNGEDKVNSYIDRIKSRTNKCTSMCCNGTFIVEAMLLVVMNDEIKEIVFDPDLLKKSWKPGQIGEYIPFNYPALLASYKHFLAMDSPIVPEELRLLRPAALERLNIGRFDLLLSQDRGYRVLRSHSNTRAYLDFMKYLGPTWSWYTNIWEPDHVVVSSCDWPGTTKEGYLPNAQHAMYALTDLFSPTSWRFSKFEKLTEIVLSNDFVTNFCESEGTPLFSAMGLACPNLKILDLSGLIRLRGESILYLFFHDTFQSLHSDMYLHKYRHEDVGKDGKYWTTYLDQTSISDVEKHSYDKYCPWCFDEGAGNLTRGGCEFNMVVFSVIDSRIWNFIEQTEFSLDLIKNSLMYGVSSEDLFLSVTRPRYKLLRPDGLKPYEQGYLPEEGCEHLKEYDGADPWYPPASINYVLYEPTNLPPALNPIAQSLQILNLPGMSLRGEMVPFLLRACPKLKSLGHGGSIPYGLELLAEYQDKYDEKRTTLNLEELEIDFDYLDENDQKDIPDYDELDGTSDVISANCPNISFLLANFGPRIFQPVTEEDKFGEVSAKEFALRVYREINKFAPDLSIEARIQSYSSLIVDFATKLKRLSLFMTSTFDVELEEDTQAG